MAMLKMFGSGSAYICAAWNGLIFPCGVSMNTATLRLPRMAYSADGPVSPDVAPEDVERRALLREHMLEQVAQQLQRHVLERECRTGRRAQQQQPRLQRRQRA